MTRVKLFKTPKVYGKFAIGFGVIILLIGIFSFIKFITGEFNTEVFSGDWTSVLNLINGLLFIAMGIYNLRNRKYFIEWNDKQIRFRLPNTKKVESIEFSKIQSVDVKLFEIELHLPNETQKFDLNSLHYDDLKKIKAKFENFSIA